MIKLTVTEQLFMSTVLNMKDNGRMISNMVRVWNLKKEFSSMTVNIKKEISTVKENILGKMDQSMKGIGLIIK